MTQYDQKVIYKFATRLYSRAQVLVLVYTMTGALVGGCLGKVYSVYTQVTASPSNAVLSALNTLGFPQAAQPAPQPTTDWTLTGILVVGLLGFSIGWNKA